MTRDMTRRRKLEHSFAVTIALLVGLTTIATMVVVRYRVSAGLVRALGF